MGSRVIVLLAVTISTAVLSSPLINNLQSGQKKPQLFKLTSQRESDETSRKSYESSKHEAEDDSGIDILHRSDKVDYTGAQVWKVSKEKSGWRAVSELEHKNLISIWKIKSTSVDVLILAHAIPNVKMILNKEKIQFEIIIENLQTLINLESSPPDKNDSELQNKPSAGHSMDWKQYHRLDEIHGFLDYLAKTYPTIASVKSIGKSHEGRDLKIIKITNGKPSNKAIFIDGGIHAREWISPATVTYIINQFAENFNAEDDNIKNIDWYFLPVLNPDGYEFSHTKDRFWRKNRRPNDPCVGVDLNRNFGYKWGGKGSENYSCSEIYRGDTAFSEPEAKAVRDFFQNTAVKFSAYLTYHSYSQFILYPWGYDNVLPPDSADLLSAGQAIAAAIKASGQDNYTVGSSGALYYPAAGASDDWAKSFGVKYSYTVELNDKGQYGFVLPPEQIEHVAKENLAGLRAMAAVVQKA